jgi:hypothetical protein
MKAKIVDPSHFNSYQERGFWSRVKSDVRVGGNEHCWPWLGATRKGRAVWRPSWKHESIVHVAARVALALTECRVIGEDEFVLHSCDNPMCCNPKHLRVGTLQDNADDRKKRGRSNHCFGPNHPNTSLTEDQVRSMRLQYAEGVTNGQLVKAFGVSKQVVCQLISGRSYKWVK